MLRGLYTGASGMLSGLEWVNTVSNNIANAATPAFKKSQTTNSSFSSVIARMQSQQVSQTLSPIGNMAIGARVNSNWLVLEQGPLRFTDSKLNAAINGPGFFVVETPNGERYTRDGRFQIDGDGWLVTLDGYRVLGQQGAIHLTGADGAIGAQGEVVAGGQVLDHLRVVDLANAGNLVQEGANLYNAGAAGMPTAIRADLSPGFVEESNVNTMAEMVDLISATRFYEANQKVIQAQDDALGKAVNEVGKVG